MPVDRQLEQLVKQKYPGLLTGLPGDRKQKILEAFRAEAAQTPSGFGFQQLSVEQTRIQTSPYPPPDFLAGYNEHIPDGANRFFTMIENQSAHRIDVEKQTINTQNTATLRGQWIALSLVLLFSAIAYRAMELGDLTLSATIFGTTITGVAAIFVTGKVFVRRNLDAKAPDKSGQKK